MPTKNQLTACPKRSSDPGAGTYWMVLLTPATGRPVCGSARRGQWLLHLIFDSCSVGWVMAA